MRTTTSRTPIESTSFVNKDDKIVTVVMNPTDTKISYKFMVDNV
jgi:glucosylceramidase